MKLKPNNYYYIRIYSNDKTNLEFFSDKKKPTTYQQIINGLKNAIEIIERMEKLKENEKVK